MVFIIFIIFIINIKIGLLAVGFKRYGDEQLLKSNPIYHLYDVYVKINQDAKLDPTIYQQANDYFKRMEEGKNFFLNFYSR